MPRKKIEVNKAEELQAAEITNTAKEKETIKIKEVKPVKERKLVKESKEKEVKLVKESKSAKEDKTLEESFAQLDSIIEELEKESVCLEDSFLLYHKGMEVLKRCSQSIDRVEKELIVLEENGIDI